MRENSSFRDPSGAVFYQDGAVYRQVNESYKDQYETLMNSGLYESLAKDGLLVRHEATDMALPKGAYVIIKPEMIPYISYPYEWSFGQLKDAALVTLKAHRRALDSDMILKDASAYNIQFMNGQALLIDTLSFELYHEGQPWIAYGQFCRHFLSPLMLMANVDIRLNQLLRVYIDGIPLDLASTLLGRKGGFSAMQHIRWHARATAQHAQDGKQKSRASIGKISKFSHTAMIDSLIRIVEGLKLKGMVTEWGDYYKMTNYVPEAANKKGELVAAYLKDIAPKTAWDFGANDGTYSRLALADGGHVVAFDIDPVAVERNYSAVKQSHERMLPLLQDFYNPSPAIGFANTERTTIGDRQHPDVILMLAVIHHMAISNNVPLARIAEWIAALTKHLIIEFVPKSDSQVKTLLATRDDIFPDYTQAGFERAFSEFFNIKKCEPISGSERTLYSMEAK